MDKSTLGYGLYSLLPKQAVDYALFLFAVPEPSAILIHVAISMKKLSCSCKKVALARCYV